jgi:hypothetical protein
MLRMQAERYFPHEYMYKLLFLSGVLEQWYEIPIENSWMYAAAKAKPTYSRSRMGRQHYG